MYRTALILTHMRMLRMDFEQDPALFTVAEYAGRCLGTVDYIKQIPYDLTKFRLKMPQDICAKHSVFIRNLWNRQYGTPKEELYDVVLEVASYARENLIRAIELQDKLPKNAHRALLQLVEAEYYLEELERHNFQVFHEGMNKPSRVVMPLRIRKAAASGKYNHHPLSYYTKN